MASYAGCRPIKSNGENCAWGRNHMSFISNNKGLLHMSSIKPLVEGSGWAFMGHQLHWEPVH